MNEFSGNLFYAALYSVKQKESSVEKHKLEEEMMLSLKFNLILLFQLLDLMVPVLPLALHLHPFSKQWSQMVMNLPVDRTKCGV